MTPTNEYSPQLRDCGCFFEKANAGRGREFLNTTAVSHLRNQVSPALADELHDLLTKQAAAIDP